MFALSRILPVPAIVLLLIPGAVHARELTVAPRLPVLVEHFNGRVVDSSLWSAASIGDGPAVASRHGRLEVTIPASSSALPGDGILGAGVVSRCAAATDFDVQVSYSLLSWPAASGVRVGLRLISSPGIFSPGPQVERTSFAATDYPGAPREAYLTYDPSQGQAQGFISTNDLSGKLRLVRTGRDLSAFYWHDSQWSSIRSWTGPNGALYFGLAVWSFPDLFIHQQAKVGFRDFEVTHGQLDCTQVFARRAGHAYSFSPRQVTVNVGTRVIWENDAGTRLSITSDTPAWKFDKKLRKGERVSFVFTKPGTYRYHSKTGPRLTGRVVAVATGGGAPTGQSGATARRSRMRGHST